MAFAERPTRRYRLRYTKLGRSGFLGHLDTVRVLGRMVRRAGVEVAYTRGFHPKPSFSFAPALSLGVSSLGELVDVAIEAGVDGAEELAERLSEVSPEGIEFTGAWELGPSSPSLAALLRGYDVAIRPAEKLSVHQLEARVARFLAAESLHVARKEKQIEVRGLVEEVSVLAGPAADKLLAALDWPAAPGLVRARVKVTSDGSAKPIEVARALDLAGTEQPGAPRAALARLGFVGASDSDATSDVPLEALLRGPIRRRRAPPTVPIAVRD